MRANNSIFKTSTGRYELITVNMILCIYAEITKDVKSLSEIEEGPQRMVLDDLEGLREPYDKIFYLHGIVPGESYGY
ncbi:Methyltransferase type 11 [Macrophomina phaseolina MS6]|uniref:Methyltransferase type 11 n=1 Tax=Macrophomina phaseolina (strain MS6) TaxID=1126212 RepID=K2S5R5_MACPH|nr:Methyltransferase type 11 [Macrophomina phaseolina MS6]